MKKSIFILVLFLFASYANAETYYWIDENGVKHFYDAPSKQTIAEPYPTNQKELEEECAWIRSEIAKWKNMPSSSSFTPSTGSEDFDKMFEDWDKMSFEREQKIARMKIAELESRAAILKCGAAFSSTHIIENQTPRSSIDECIKACKTHTNWSSEQCFDRCNK